jgi:hypothetical protein
VDLDDRRMLVFYALTGLESDQLVSSIVIQFTADGGKRWNLLQAIHLGKLHQVEAGVLVFPPHPRKASQLSIQFSDRTNGKTILTSPFAERSGPSDEDIPGRNFVTRRDEPVEASGERIWFGYGLATTVASILTTPSPSPLPLEPKSTSTGPLPTISPHIRTPGLPSPKGVIVDTEYNFRSENLADGSVQVINLQILSNGDLLIQNSGTWTVAARLPVAPMPTPTPTEPPYPYPQPLDVQTFGGSSSGASGYPIPAPLPYPNP